MTETRLLVPVSDSDTLRDTVAYVVREASTQVEESRVSPEIHFVYPLSGRLGINYEPDEAESARTLLDRVSVWVEEDLGEDAATVTVETALIGTEEYLFSPADYADVLADYATQHDLDVAVFDPGFTPLGTTPLLPTLETEVRNAGLEVREAPVTRSRQGALLARRGTLEQGLTLFGVSFVFYLLLAGTVDLFNVVTGAISGVVVAVALWGVSLTSPVRPGVTIRRALRFGLYVPYLVVQIAVANLQIAYVVLHPDLPIDPEVVEFDAAVWSALPVTTLANSITLTPGTLTVDVSQRHFTVHTLTGSARSELLGGALERAVRFVFYGRSAARIPSPEEREGTER